MMTRLYTEDVNRDALLSLLDDRLQSYTLIEAVGRFGGVSERSVVIEVAGLDAYEAHQLARDIGALNGQKCVGVIHTKDVMEFVTPCEVDVYA
jgi:hypothetical protein